MSDRDENVMARNVFILLLFGMDDVDITLDTAIHLWYSARLQPKHKQVLENHVRPIVADVVGKTSSKQDSILLSNTVPWASGSLKIVLYRPQWQHMLRVLDVTLGSDTTERNRKDVVLGRRDHLDREQFRKIRRLHRRVSVAQYKNRGVLLPFSVDDKPFSEPNP